MLHLKGTEKERMRIYSRKLITAGTGYRWCGGLVATSTFLCFSWLLGRRLFHFCGQIALQATAFARMINETRLVIAILHLWRRMLCSATSSLSEIHPLCFWNTGTILISEQVWKPMQGINETFDNWPRPSPGCCYAMVPPSSCCCRAGTGLWRSRAGATARWCHCLCCTLALRWTQPSSQAAFVAGFPCKASQGHLSVSVLAVPLTFLGLRQ